MSSEEKKGFFWNMLGSGLNSCTSLLYILMVTRINGIDAAGVISVCFSLSFTLQTLVFLGSRTYQVSDLRGDDSDYHTLKLFAAVLTLLIGYGFCRISGYNGEKTLLTMLLTLVRVVESASDTIYGLEQKKNRLDLVGKSCLLKCLCSLALFLIADLATGSMLISCLVLLGTAAVLYALYDLPWSRRLGTLQYNKDSLRRCPALAKSMLSFVLFNFITVLICNVPRLIADRYYTETQMGFFSIIFMVPSVMALFGVFVIQPFVPSMAKDAEEGNRLHLWGTLGKMAAVLVALALVCALGAWLVGVPVLSLVFGNDFGPYRLTLVLAVVAGTFSVLTTEFSTLLTTLRRTRIQLLLYLISVMLETGLVLFGVLRCTFDQVFLLYSGSMLLEFLAFGVTALLYCPPTADRAQGKAFL